MYEFCTIILYVLKKMKTLLGFCSFYHNNENKLNQVFIPFIFFPLFYYYYCLFVPFCDRKVKKCTICHPCKYYVLSVSPRICEKLFLCLMDFMIGELKLLDRKSVV